MAAERWAYVDVEGVTERHMEGTPEKIAAAFSVPVAKVEQVAEWADEMGCAQGFATGPTSSVIVEPAS